MAFGQHTDDEQQMMAEINMTPFVDVMLVLLIIFIIAMPVITQTMLVELPKVKQQQAPSPSESISIVVRKNGSILWQQTEIDLNALTQKLNHIASQSPQPHVSLHGAAQVPYEEVVKVMAAAQQAGVKSLNFATQLSSS